MVFCLRLRPISHYQVLSDSNEAWKNFGRKHLVSLTLPLQMEREGNGPILEEKFDPEGQASILSSTLSLDQVGEVVLTFNSDGLSWKPVEPMVNEEAICFGLKSVSKVATELKLADIYAVELTSYGLICTSNLPLATRGLLGPDLEIYGFVVHGVLRKKTQPSPWILATYTFRHKNQQTCQMWVDRLNASLNLEPGRPRNLLVFVNPRSGKGNGCRTWEKVAPIFSRAKVNTKVIVTERAGQALNMMLSITSMELKSYDGVVAVGGDGFFNEILNGFLSPRLKAPDPPAPSDFIHSVKNNRESLADDANETVEETSNQSEVPLLSSPTENGSTISNSIKKGKNNGVDCLAFEDSTDKDHEFPIPNDWFRFGIIPAGSTDAIVICTTGSRDPITSALHIVLGKRVHLDIAQVVRWKTTARSEVEPFVRYAASFAGYGFYGDVITESEKYRWMGPKRYDYAGTMVFLKHRSYEAEVTYLEVESDETKSTHKMSRLGMRALWSPYGSERSVCRVNCNVCNAKPNQASSGTPHSMLYSSSEDAKWVRSKGRFLSVGAAVISCRNEKAPDGLVADAHLSDGFLHLILIRDCSHASYLWHLTQLARRGGNPLNFKFVEHHKTTAFAFTSLGNESTWNLDGELFQAHQLSAQVFRGLVSLFASGPED